VEFFDSHAHVGLARFGDPEARQTRLQRAFGAGVREIMVPGVFAGDVRWLPKIIDACSAQVEGMRLIYGLGLHPYALIEQAAEDDDLSLAEIEAEVLESSDARLRAVGECGLDFPHAREHGIPRARQVQVTRRQLDLSRRTGRPAILHCVRSHPAMLELLDEKNTPACVMHSFSGSPEIAHEYLRRGHFLSFSGSITGERSRKTKRALLIVPEDRLLIETDSPDQTPTIKRPELNEPANLVLVAESVAHLRGQKVGEIAELTTSNARQIFGLDEGNA
jgi:TatD DNase family protein